MIFPQNIQSPAGELSIMLATRNDLYPVLKLFDEAVAWLNARGLVDQWGSEPFSISPHWYKQFLDWINRDNFFIARLGEQIVGSLALSPIAPWYIVKRWLTFPASALYLEAFTTTRSLAGQGIGRAILQWTEYYTRDTGRSAIWLDCWAENAALVHYYEQAGFTPHETFIVNDWRGQLFEKQLPAS